MLRRPPADGFGDPVGDSQSAFRSLLAALSNPGSIIPIPSQLQAPEGIGRAFAAVVLTLIDHETPVWLDNNLARQDAVKGWLAFHTGAPVVQFPGESAFGLISDPVRMPSRGEFSLGSQQFPDRSTSLIVAVEELSDTVGWPIEGPGVNGRKVFSAGPMGANFWTESQALRDIFPCGNDVFFTCGANVAALPRSTRIGSAES